MAATRARSFHWTPGLILGCVLLVAVALVAVVAPLVWGTAADGMGERSAAPSAAHLLGTDAAGHDILARTLVATRLTLLMTIGATAIPRKQPSSSTTAKFSRCGRCSSYRWRQVAAKPGGTGWGSGVNRAISASASIAVNASSCSSPNGTSRIVPIRAA